MADLPDNTLALFACKADEQAFEHSSWGHGAMTKVLLELLPGLAGDQQQFAVGIIAPLTTNVSRLVSGLNNGRDRQTIHPILNGNPQLKLESLSPPQPQSITNSMGMRLRLIPAGSFLMGSTESKAELERKGLSLYEGFDNSDEQPQHQVKISRDFYMGVHEVTLGQFLSYYNADRANHQTEAEKDGKGGWGYDGKEYSQKPEYVAWNTGWNKPVENYMDHPVVNVSWNDAMAFCQWLTVRERKAGRIGADQEYRLPTEAEWEYACRGGSRTSQLFSFGDNGEEFTLYGNVKDAEFAKQFSNPYGEPIQGNDGYVFTSAVGSFQANGFGLYDMHGNVWEWYMDVYDGKVYSQRSDETKDPLVTTEGSYRVFRGGSWDDSPVRCRSAIRDENPPVNRGNDLGFRVSLSPVQ